MATTKETVEAQIESVMQTLLTDLRRRKMVNIAPLISGIEYDIKNADVSGIEIIFTFRREKAEVKRMESGLMVFDPLFKKMKPFAIKNSDRNTYGKKSIYNKISNWFDKKLVPALIEVNVDLARNIVLKIV